MAQRRCFEHISGHLGSIQNLIKDLGPTSLKDFCETGFLSQEIIAKVAEAKGPTQTQDADEEESDAESDEESDEDPDAEFDPF